MSEPIPTATKCALYTPTTEQVREEFATRMSPAMDATRRPAFDRWLAYHDAQVRRVAKVEALREAASDLHDLDPKGDAVFWDGEYYVFVHGWLHERAGQLEREGQNDE